MKYGQAIFEAAQTRSTSRPAAPTRCAISPISREDRRARRAGRVYNGTDGVTGPTMTSTRSCLGEQLCRHAGEGGLSRASPCPVASCRPIGVDREPVPVRRDVLGSGVLGADADRPGVRVRAGDAASRAAGEHAAAALGHRPSSVVTECRWLAGAGHRSQTGSQSGSVHPLQAFVGDLERLDRDRARLRVQFRSCPLGRPGFDEVPARHLAVRAASSRMTLPFRRSTLPLTTVWRQFPQRSIQRDAALEHECSGTSSVPGSLRIAQVSALAIARRLRFRSTARCTR